jgi:hypothetical protein
MKPPLEGGQGDMRAFTDLSLKDFCIAERLAYSADTFLKIKTICLHYVLPEMHSFSIRPAKYFHDKPLPKYIDLKTLLIYRPHPVCRCNCYSFFDTVVLNSTICSLLLCVMQNNSITEIETVLYNHSLHTELKCVKNLFLKIVMQYFEIDANW